MCPSPSVIAIFFFNQFQCTHSQFNNREELIWAIVGSICLPIVIIRDFPIKLNDEGCVAEHYMSDLMTVHFVPFVHPHRVCFGLFAQVGFVLDGGFSNDAPCLDSYTITVSALHR